LLRQLDLVKAGQLFSVNSEVSPFHLNGPHSVLALCNFYLTTWEEYHTGVLFLGYFNGPVEGILMITLFYFVTAVYGISDRLSNSYSRSAILVSEHIRARPFDTTFFGPKSPGGSPFELPFPRLLSLQPRRQYSPKVFPFF